MTLLRARVGKKGREGKTRRKQEEKKKKNKRETECTSIKGETKKEENTR